MFTSAEKVKQSFDNMQTVSDLKSALLEIEKNLYNSNKSLLAKLCGGFNRLTELLHQKAFEIFPIAISWFQLYMKMQNAIHPTNNQLMHQYEKTVPTAITYIIGCLQYKPKDDSNFHLNLLEIIDALLHNSRPNVVKQCANFSSGTIARMWKPICIARDFNTQTLALKIFAKLMKSLDMDKVEDELKEIKWSNLNFFKDKLNKVIEGTTQVHAYESNTEKFWIDLNFGPKTVSFKGRHKSRNNSDFKDVEVNLKWTKIQMTNDCLFLTFEKAEDSLLPPYIISKLKEQDLMVIYLQEQEVERIKDHKDLLQWPNLEGTEDVEVNNEGAFEINIQTKTPEPIGQKNVLSETPVTSRSEKHYSLRQTKNKRKFFSYLEENDDLPKQKKRKTSKKKPRILKTSNEKKSVCKVVPVVVDLTRTPELQTNKSNRVRLLRDITNLEQQCNSDKARRLSDKQCLSILKKVSCTTGKQEIYNYNSESDAEPCQSYHSFKTSSNYIAGDTDDGTQKTNINKRCGKTLENSQKPIKPSRPLILDRSNKVSENYDVNTSSFSNSYKRKMPSQNIFDQLKDNESTRSSKVARSCLVENITEKITSSKKLQADNESSAECDELRSGTIDMCSTPITPLHTYPKTPPSRCTMNVSDINNTTDVMDTTDHFLLQKPRTENYSTNYSLFGVNNEALKEALIDYEINNDHENTEFGVTKQSTEKINDSLVDVGFEQPEEDCVIYRKRLGSYSSESENGNDFNSFAETLNKNKKIKILKNNSSTKITSYKNDIIEKGIKNNKVFQTGHNTTSVACSQQQQTEVKNRNRNTFLYNTHIKSTLINSTIYKEQRLTLCIQQSCGNLGKPTLSHYNINENTENRFELSNDTRTLNADMVPQFRQETESATNQVKSSMEQSIETRNININNFPTEAQSLTTITALKVFTDKSDELHDNTELSLVAKQPLVLTEKNNNDDHIYAVEGSQCSVSKSYTPEKIDKLEKDISTLKEQYYSKHSNIVNGLRYQGIAKTFTDTKARVRDLTENIVQQSKKHRKELDLLQKTMQRLLQQLECHYAKYVKRNKQFQCFQENAEILLDAFGSLNLQPGIISEYQDVIDKLNIDESNICQEIWQQFFEVNKQNLMETINSLSEI